MAELFCPETKLTLEVYSDYPAMQVYSGNFIEGSPRRVGEEPYHNYGGIALEPEFYPDSVNHEIFRKRCPILKAGEKFHKSISFKILIDHLPEIQEPEIVLFDEFDNIKDIDCEDNVAKKDTAELTPDSSDDIELNEDI